MAWEDWIVIGGFFAVAGGTLAIRAALVGWKTIIQERARAAGETHAEPLVPPRAPRRHVVFR